METRELIHRLEQSFKEGVVSAADEGVFPFVQVTPQALKSALSFCVHDQEMRFDFLECITALDSGEEIVLLYHLQSMAVSHRITIKVAVPRHNPTLPSAIGFWRAARTYELEIAEMLGVEFDGHSGMKHLLLPDDWQGHPLRQDYVYPEEYHGVEHRRQPLRKEHIRP